MGYQPQLRRSHEKIDRSRWSRVLTLAAAVIGDCAQAAAVAPGGLRQGADELVIVEKAQFEYRGKRYCWYWDGWRGPGWHWCGSEWHRGLGWGGASGWRGWRRPVHRPAVVHPRRPNRPGVCPPSSSRPGVNRQGNRPGAGANPAQDGRPSGSCSGGNRGSGRGGDHPG